MYGSTSRMGRWVVGLVCLTATWSWADDPLAGANDRIQQHRTRTVRLVLHAGEASPSTSAAPPASSSPATSAPSADQTQTSASSPLPAGTPIRIEMVRHRFLFGCNLYMLGRLSAPELETAYRARFAELFNYATLAFYWWAYEPKPGQPTYDSTDQSLAWCAESGILPKGHPLAWNYRDVAWLPDDPAEVARLQIERIGTCAKHFAGRLDYWDVVNEAAHYDRDSCKQQSAKLTAAIEHMGLGEYLRAAFRAARQANPKATLLINDYRLDPQYADRVLNELVDEQGRPLYDAIGLQSHQHGGAIPLENVWEVCERYAKFGKPLHWTENTFISGEPGWDLPAKQQGFDWASTPEGEQRQAQDVEQFYTLLFSHPAVEAITWWDLTDLHSWMAAPSGLIRKDMSPKPAYDVLRRLIKQQWWTRQEAVLAEDGSVSFRGFLGDYQITVGSGDRACTYQFTLDPNTPETIVLQPAPNSMPGR